MRRRNSGRRAYCVTWAISSLPPWSFGWALPEKMNLHRPVLVVDDGRQPLEVAEDQVAALVSGEAAGEADGQRIRDRGPRRRLRSPPAGARGAAIASSSRLPGEGDERSRAAFVGPPQFGVGNASTRCQMSKLVGSSSHWTPR